MNYAFDFLDDNGYFFLDDASLKKSNVLIYDCRSRGKPLEDYIDVISGDENNNSINNVEDIVPNRVLSENSYDYTEKYI